MSTASEKCDEMLILFKEWRDNLQPIDRICSETIRSLSLVPGPEFCFLSPQLTKDLYYSPFVHELLALGMETGGNVHCVLEVWYTMAFTPSPSR